MFSLVRRLLSWCPRAHLYLLEFPIRRIHHPTLVRFAHRSFALCRDRQAGEAYFSSPNKATWSRPRTSDIQLKILFELTGHLHDQHFARLGSRDRNESAAPVTNYRRVAGADLRLQYLDREIEDVVVFCVVASSLLNARLNEGLHVPRIRLS